MNDRMNNKTPLCIPISFLIFWCNYFLNSNLLAQWIVVYVMYTVGPIQINENVVIKCHKKQIQLTDWFGLFKFFCVFFGVFFWFVVVGLVLFSYRVWNILFSPWSIHFFSWNLKVFFPGQKTMIKTPKLSPSP